MRTGGEGKATALPLFVGAFFAAVVFAGCGYTPGVTRLSTIKTSATGVPKAQIQKDFLSATQCAFCHPAEHRQWATSMHAYAMNSPVFIAFNNFVLRSSGGTLGVFCTRCHSPIGISSGESAILPNDKRDELSRESVTCMVCHGAHTRDGQASGVFHSPIPGQGKITVYGPYYGHDEPGAPKDPAMRLIKSPHKSRHWPVITTGRFCGNCHDVFLNDGTNVEEAYSEWKNSPYARKGVTCQDCHMSPVPGKPVPFVKGPIVDPDLFPNAPIRARSSHMFTGPDYSIIPNFGKEALGLDAADFKAHELLLDKQRVELIRNGATMKVSNSQQVAPGARLKVAVALTNSGSGHNFPTGFVAERQIWVEVMVHDATGRLLFVSGDLDRNGDLRDADADLVKAGAEPIDYNLENLEANFILQDFKGTQSEFVSSVNRLIGPAPFVNPSTTPVSLMGFAVNSRVFKRGIPPFATRTAHYSIDVPDGVKGPLQLRVRLRFRNLPSHFVNAIGLGKIRPMIRTNDIYTYHSTIALNG
jgi:Cytochrome c554 and c-prime